jgi:hypothetical protein
MFTLEFFSKSLFLFMIGYLTVNIYGLEFGSEYTSNDNFGRLRGTEYFLIILLLSHILYELGQFLDEDWSMDEYVRDDWNVMDVSEIILISAWAILRCFTHYFTPCRVMLALAAIPTSLGMFSPHIITEAVISSACHPLTNMSCLSAFVMISI